MLANTRQWWAGNSAIPSPLYVVAVFCVRLFKDSFVYKSPASFPVQRQPLPYLSPLSRNLHTTLPALSRLPKLPVRITRKAWARNLDKIEKLKKALGPRYRPLGRDKRRSPITERRSSTTDSQPPKTPPPPMKIEPFLFSKKRLQPEPIISRDVKQTIDSIKDKLREDEAAREAAAKISSSKDALLKGNFARFAEKPKETGTLSLPEDAIPTPPPAPVLPEVLAETDAAKKLSLPQTTGPYYAYHVTPTEAAFLLRDVPKADELNPTRRSASGTTPNQQAEMLRRILTMENANVRQMKKFNIARALELFGRKPGDSGSPAAQIAVLTVRIKAMQEHLDGANGNTGRSVRRKDIWTKRRMGKLEGRRFKILRYLRRVDLKTYVETCKALGLEPDDVKTPFKFARENRYADEMRRVGLLPA
ncbi:hypothetical protein HDV00_001872 [Rhizophlyctis rosea]|nr:hypothetical protein HDV00_001872 [Rhizophlyctis rosea]